MKRIAIKNICEVYDGPHATPKKTETGPVYLGIDAITEDGMLDSSQFSYLSKEDYIKWTKRVVPQENDIVFSYEATLGKYALIPRGFYGCLGRRLAIIRVISEEIDAKWLYYYFRSPEWNAFIKNQTVKGSTVDRISVEEFPNYTIPVISLKNQKKMVAVLEKIDAKIRTNNKINDYLEEMAKTIYDYWFVQFEFPDENGNPYKSTGGKMSRTKDFGLAPCGWKFGNLYDIAEFINGLACQKYRPMEDEASLPVIKIKEMHDGISSDTERVKATIPEKNIVNTGDILFSWSASLEVQHWAGTTGGLNQHIFKVIPKKGYSSSYVYHQLQAYVIKFIQMADARKTTMGHITSDHLRQSIIVLPPENIVRNFSQQVDDIHAEINHINIENHRLSQLRDWLLPMLMNGQATIED